MKLVHLSLVAGIAISLSTSSFAQYSGSGMGGTGRGYSSSTGIAVGAGAGAGLALLYLTLHNRGTMVGCVDAVDGGLKLVSAGKHESYALEGLNGLPPGTKVRVKGKEQTDGDGRKTFVVNKLVKEYGPCEK